MTFLRPAPICLVVAGLLLVLQVLSYSSLHYVHPGRSWRISLGQGQLRLWWSNPGDLNYRPAGFSTGSSATSSVPCCGERSPRAFPPDACSPLLSG